MRSKSEVIHQAKKEGKTSPFHEFDGPLSSDQTPNLQNTIQKYMGRVVLRVEDNVKDEEGYRAVFTEQGASASEMAAAKFLDTISKLLGMAGETSDAISACTQV